MSERLQNSQKNEKQIEVTNINFITAIINLILQQVRAATV